MRELKLVALIRSRGLTLHRVHRDGRALRLIGPGVHVLVADLAHLTAEDCARPTRNLR